MSDLDYGIEAAHERMRSGSAEFIAGLRDWQRLVSEKMTVLHARQVGAALRGDVALQREVANIREEITRLNGQIEHIQRMLTIEDDTP